MQRTILLKSYPEGSGGEVCRNSKFLVSPRKDKVNINLGHVKHFKTTSGALNLHSWPEREINHHSIQQ